jgi:hypothetical protein
MQGASDLGWLSTLSLAGKSSFLRRACSDIFDHRYEGEDTDTRDARVLRSP